MLDPQRDSSLFSGANFGVCVRREREGRNFDKAEKSISRMETQHIQEEKEDRNRE